MNRKEDNISKIENKLKNTIERAIKKNDCEKALQGIDTCSELLYYWNQQYVDEQLEEYIKKIIEVQKYNLAKQELDKKTIMFYDNFGLDTRGLALIYLKAILSLNYRVVYVTNNLAKGQQPEIEKLFENSNDSEIIYFNNRSRLKKINKLVEIYQDKKPKNVFFYSTPNDSAGVVAFELFTQSIRYQIDLTDHAFWLGKYCFDYCLEFRDYGASISYNQRKIDKSKLIMQPYYPYVNYDLKFEGFDFSTLNKKIIFSGGALYKTIGKDNYFYKIIDEILQARENTIFVYAGQTGNDFYLKQLAKKYNDRVFKIPERKDLFQTISNVDIYINTYPMVGGLMMQYASIAGKPPLTLKTSNDGDGILLNQENINIEFGNYKEVVKEALNLLDNDEYRIKREKEIKKAVINENDFKNSLGMLLKEQRTPYEINIKNIDTNEFQKEYKSRFNEENINYYIAKKDNWKLIGEYLLFFIKKALLKVKIG